jgi:hypothetical protein
MPKMKGEEPIGRSQFFSGKSKSSMKMSGKSSNGVSPFQCPSSGFTTTISA